MVAWHLLFKGFFSMTKPVLPNDDFYRRCLELFGEPQSCVLRQNTIRKKLRGRTLIATFTLRVEGYEQLVRLHIQCGRLDTHYEEALPRLKCELLGNLLESGFARFYAGIRMVDVETADAMIPIWLENILDFLAK